MLPSRRILPLLPAAMLLLAPLAAMPADAWVCYSVGVQLCVAVDYVIDKENHVVEIIVTISDERTVGLCVYYEEGAYWVAVSPDGCQPRPESPIPGFHGIPGPSPDDLLP
jgi:hypothetical protein